MPATWESLISLVEIATPCSARLVRRFGLPTGIGPEDQLRIIVESEEPACQVSLNGQLLENETPGQAIHSYDVTALLALRNELEIRLEIPRADSATPQSAFPIRDVWLEISQRT